MKASAALQGMAIIESDFEAILDRASAGDVVYCDPTYTVTHDRNGFVRYNETNFAWNDQVRLAAAARRAGGRGVVILISNAHHRSVRNLYPEAKVMILKRTSLVSRDPTKRRPVKEYLFLLRKPSPSVAHGKGSPATRFKGH